MSIQAVIFDYGEVLCHADQNAYQDLLTLTGLDQPTFESIYWRDRHQYDLGLFDGVGFWQRFGAHTGRTFTPAEIDALIEADVRMWTSTDPVMLSWVASLQRAGLRTAILSNMVPEVLHTMLQSPDFAWLRGFTQLTWSCELHIAKPNPAIYQHTSESLAISPAETLFLDDKPVNIRGAQATGMQALLFTTPEQLRDDLKERGWLLHLPQPGRASKPDDGTDVLLAVL
ncbi:MAG TPA: HAD family phosphatase [Acidobacteriaceae bacterium]|jgi:putative hydrolase of the HAD superfamily|nr:HAD family phosphatase [Acidobacteriaceae bacterium]